MGSPARVDSIDVIVLRSASGPDQPLEFRVESPDRSREIVPFVGVHWDASAEARAGRPRPSRHDTWRLGGAIMRCYSGRRDPSNAQGTVSELRGSVDANGTNSIDCQSDCRGRARLDRHAYSTDTLDRSRQPGAPRLRSVKLDRCVDRESVARSIARSRRRAWSEGPGGRGEAQSEGSKVAMNTSKLTRVRGTSSYLVGSENRPAQPSLAQPSHANLTTTLAPFPWTGRARDAPAPGREGRSNSRDRSRHSLTPGTR